MTSDAAAEAERLIRGAAVVAVLSCLAVTVIGFVNERTFENRLLDPNEEFTPMQWVSVAMTVLAALAAAWYAVAVGDRRRMLLLSCVIGCFALDDAFELHERVAHHLADDIGGWYANVAFRVWVVILFPLMAVAFLLLVRFATRALPVVRLAIYAGLARSSQLSASRSPESSPCTPGSSPSSTAIPTSCGLFRGWA